MILKLISWLLKKWGYTFTIQKDKGGSLVYYSSSNIGEVNPAAKLKVFGGNGHIGI